MRRIHLIDQRTLNIAVCGRTCFQEFTTEHDSVTCRNCIAMAVSARLQAPKVNQFVTISDITKRTLEQLKDNLVFARQINRSYDYDFEFDGPKVGDTIVARKPAKYKP